MNKNYKLEVKKQDLEKKLLKHFISKQKNEKERSFYDTLLANIMYPIVVTTFEGNFLYLNKKAFDFLTIPPPKISNLYSLDFWYDKSKRQEFINDLKQNKRIENKQFKFIINERIFVVLLSAVIFETPQNERVILTVFNDITEEKRFNQQLLMATINTEERERQRLSQDLHDSLAPLFAGAKMYLQSLPECVNNNQSSKKIIAKTIALIEEAYKTSREISHNLTPQILQKRGLLAALYNLAEQIEQSRKISIIFDIKDPTIKNELNKLSIQKQTVIYRVLNECICNTLKHARATEILIAFSGYSNFLEITCSDNGIGFDVTKISKGLGLFNMQNRLEAINGSIEIQSKKNTGTIVNIKLAKCEP